MAYARLVSLAVSDAKGYARYRQEMGPIMESHTGRFVIDVDNPTVLTHPAPFVPNRMLLLEFDSEAHAAAFFADPAYQAIRAKHFAPSVDQVHAIVMSTPE